MSTCPITTALHHDNFESIGRDVSDGTPFYYVQAVDGGMYDGDTPADACSMFLGDVAPAAKTPSTSICEPTERTKASGGRRYPQGQRPAPARPSVNEARNGPGRAGTGFQGIHEQGDRRGYDAEGPPGLERHTNQWALGVPALARRSDSRYPQARSAANSLAGQFQQPQYTGHA